MEIDIIITNRALMGQTTDSRRSAPRLLLESLLPLLHLQEVISRYHKIQHTILTLKKPSQCILDQQRSVLRFQEEQKAIMKIHF